MSYLVNALKNRAMIATICLCVSVGTFAEQSNLPKFKKGDLVSIKEHGFICRSMDGAIAARNIEMAREDGRGEDVQQILSYGCLSYSIRPIKIIAYNDYIVPGYPELGRIFVDVREPRSGDIWYAPVEFLEKYKG
ncbi:Uncharacterised protein [Serratia proteamaculans]|uniref:hypothetical protein n=1 Tax=Serratia proteamaculans TaxID=28151 RepID=UPI002183261C|nr:hypothetical protein [Serratia proteamaculans]CAI2428184.1 Uncharacterised protein [Serratia proteamaculans]